MGSQRRSTSRSYLDITYDRTDTRIKTIDAPWLSTISHLSTQNYFKPEGDCSKSCHTNINLAPPPTSTTTTQLSPHTLSPSIMPAPTPYPSRSSTPDPSALPSSSSSKTPTLTSSSKPKLTEPKPPTGWIPAMSQFVRDAMGRGEDAKSVIILLETEWPVLREKVGVEWVHGINAGRRV